MRIGWIGFHMEGIPALQAVIKQGIKIEAVITLESKLAMKRSGAGNYRTICQQFQLPLYEVANINDPASVELLRTLALDVVFVIGWTQILRAEALRTAKIGMIGAHASLLPHNRGRAPVNWALIKGETQTGNSLIWLAEDVDSGPIIDQTVIPISLYDTCASVYERVAESNAIMILRALSQLLSGQRPGRPQEHTDEPLLPGRRPEDGLIDWTKDNRGVYNFVRALTRPYPGAFSWLDGRRWFVWQSALLPEDYVCNARPGQVIGSAVSPVEAACGQVVACGRGAIILLEIERDDGELLTGRRLSDQPWSGKVWGNE